MQMCNFDMQLVIWNIMKYIHTYTYELYNVWVSQRKVNLFLFLFFPFGFLLGWLASFTKEGYMYIKILIYIYIYLSVHYMVYNWHQYRIYASSTLISMISLKAKAEKKKKKMKKRIIAQFVVVHWFISISQIISP